MSHKSIYLLFVSILLSSLALSAGNLLFNPDFELGDHGYGGRKYLRLDTNEAMEYLAPAIDVSTAARGGQSLRIPNPYSEETELFTKEFQLEAGSVYTLSLDMKCSSGSYPVQLRILSYSGRNKRWWFDSRKEVQIDPEWKRYSLTFKTPAALNTGEEEFYTLVINSAYSPQVQGQEIWIDGLRLVKGRDAQWKPSPGIELSVSSSEKVYFVDHSDPGSATVTIDTINNAAKPAQIPLRLNVVNDLTNDIYFTEALNLSINANERTSLMVPVPLQQYGAYRVELLPLNDDAKAEITVLDGYFAVAGIYEPRELNLDETLYVGLNNVIGYAPLRWGIGRRGFPASGISPEDYLQLLANMGCRVLRTWDGEAGWLFIWQDNQPAAGQFDFSVEDWAVPLAAKHGIAILPVVGDWMGHAKERNRGLPQWVKEQSVKRTVTPYNNRPETTPYLPPEGIWREYVRQIAERFNGQITHYEVINEPNADYFADEYLVFLRSAYEELKQVNSENRIIGFCSSGDWGLPSASFLVESAELGALNYADIVSYHPYETPKYPSASEKNQDYLDIIRHYESDREIPLWNTEIYYISDTPKSVACTAGDLAQRFLVDLGDGLGQSISLLPEVLWHKPLTPNMHPGRMAAQWQPNSNYVAYNALARLFEGARPALRFEPVDGAICFIYTREDKAIAAFWKYDHENKVSIRLADSSGNAGLFDTLGNRLEADAQYPIDSDPYYLQWSNGNVDELVSYIKDSEFLYENPLLPSSVVPVFSNAKGTYAAVTFKNFTNAAALEEFHLKGEQAALSVSIPANTEETVIVPFTPSVPGAYATELVVGSAAEAAFPVCIVPYGRVYHANGNPESVRKNIRSVNAEHAATFSIRTDAGYLQIAIDVTDASVSGAANGRQPWEQDSVELFFDMQPAAFVKGCSGSYTNHVVRMFVLPHEDGTKQLIIDGGDSYGLSAGNVGLSVSTNDNGYAVELRISLDAFNTGETLSGSLFGFDIIINNAIGFAKAASSLSWSTSGDAYKNRLSFGLVELQ